MQRPVVDATYKDVIASIEQIAHLQQEVEEVSVLTSYLLSLKRLMNIGEGDDESRVEEGTKQMEHWISMSIANQPQSVESYIAVVCSWLSGWERLNEIANCSSPRLNAYLNSSPSLRETIPLSLFSTVEL